MSLFCHLADVWGPDCPGSLLLVRNIRCSSPWKFVIPDDAGPIVQLIGKPGSASTSINDASD